MVHLGAAGRHPEQETLCQPDWRLSYLQCVQSLHWYEESPTPSFCTISLVFIVIVTTVPVCERLVKELGHWAGTMRSSPWCISREAQGMGSYLLQPYWAKHHPNYHCHSRHGSRQSLVTPHYHSPKMAVKVPKKMQTGSTIQKNLQCFEREKYEAAGWIIHSSKGTKQRQIKAWEARQHMHLPPHVFIFWFSTDTAVRKGSLPAIS